MQVNPIDNLPCAAAETSTTKTSENTDPGSAGSFFAQIGQIMRREDEGSQDQTEDASSDQKQTQTCSDSLNAFPVAPILTTVVEELVPVQINIDAGSEMPPDGDFEAAAVSTEVSEITGESSNIPLRSVQTEMRPSFQMPSSVNVPKAVEESQALLGGSIPTSPGNANTPVLHDESNKAVSYRNADSGALPRISTDPVIAQSEDLETESGVLEDPNFSKARILDQLEGTLTAKPENANTGDQNAVKHAVSRGATIPKDFQTRIDGMPANPEFVQAALHSSRNVAGLRTEAFPIPGESGFIDNGQTIRNSNAAAENSQATVAKKLENAVMAALESANTGDSTGEQDAHQTASAAWTMLQSRLESSQPNPGFPKSGIADNQQNAFSQLLSNHMRVSDSNVLKMPGDAQPPAAQNRNFLFELAERIQFQVREGEGHLRIQLKPDSLGRLEINAETAGAVVVARITTESGSVKTYLENNLHVLQQTLQDNGLKVDRIHIVVQDAFNQQSSSGNTTNSGHAGSGQNDEKPNGFSRNGSVESSTENSLQEMTIDPMTWIALNPNVRFHTIA
jgi:flagellar hook-length control protein FliK